MRIGVVTDFYYPWIGGPATFIRNLGQALHARGHTVALLAPSPDGKAHDEEDGGIHVRRVRTLPVPFGYRMRVASLALADAGRWLDLGQPEVVHIQHPFPLSAAAAWQARRRGIPVVATNHTVPMCSLWGLRTVPVAYPLLSRALDAWIVALLGRCEAVTTPTETAARLLAEMGYRRPISVISNGVDTHRFRPGPRSAELAARLGLDARPVVLYTGRLDAEKQMEVWFRAAALLARTADVQFLVGGKGSERTRLEALAAGLDLSQRLHFFGYLSEDEYPAVYRLADVFCITAPVELQSITTLEALASGLPAVGVRAAALPELIHDGENGYLADPGDAPGVAGRLAELLSDSVRRGTMGERSRTIAQTHDLRHTIVSYESFLLGASRRKEPAAV